MSVFCLCISCRRRLPGRERFRLFALLLSPQLELAPSPPKRDQRVSDRLLHRIGGRAVEDHPIDHRLDADTATNELTHGIGYVFVVASEAVNPANHQCVAVPKNVEKTPTFGAFTQASGDTRNAMVRQHYIRRKSNLDRRGLLVIESLIDGTYAAIKNGFHAWLSCPLGCCPVGDVSAEESLASAVRKAKVFLVPPRL